MVLRLTKTGTRVRYQPKKWRNHKTFMTGESKISGTIEFQVRKSDKLDNSVNDLRKEIKKKKKQKKNFDVKNFNDFTKEITMQSYKKERDISRLVQKQAEASFNAFAKSLSNLLSRSENFLDKSLKARLKNFLTLVYLISVIIKVKI